jgi:uncharacterized membrane protein HdeD (DUF308 family)
MTDPQNSPVDQQAGSGQARGSGQPDAGATSTGMPGTGKAGAGATGAGVAGSTGTSQVVTETRSTTQQKSVPPQFGRPAEATRGRGYGEQIATPGLGADGGIMSRAANFSWGAVLFGGLCMMAAGIALLVWPHVTLTIVAWIIGAALIVSGFMRLFEGFTSEDKSGGMKAAYVVIGILAVIAGIFCLRDHALSLFLVAFVTGLYFILHGIADLGVAASGKVPGRGVRGVLGAFSLFAGIIMLVWPGLTLVLLLSIVGAWLILYGVVLAGLAFGLRKASKNSSASARPTMTAGSERLATSRR